MKIVFAHDHKFRKIENDYYSTGGLSDEALNRYTDVFDEVTILARVVEQKSDDRKLSKITNSKVKIIKTHWNNEYSKNIEKYIEQSDGVIARLPSFIGNLAIDMAKKYNKPYLIEVVGCALDSLWNYNLLGKAIAPIIFIKTRHLIKKAPFVIYVTKNFLQKRYPNIGKSIECSDVSLGFFNEVVLNKRLDKIKNMSFNRPIILGTIGAIDVSYKGQEYVIKAISKIEKEKNDFIYLLVGGGDDKYLKSLAKKYGVIERVKFLGSLPHDNIFEFIDSLDIYIQPSKTEGLPRAMVEAMSRACPVIGSNAGGIPELANKDMIFNVGRTNELCKLLENINKETMMQEAIRSFEVAHGYNKETLDKKRSAFFYEFAYKIAEYNK